MELDDLSVDQNQVVRGQTLLESHQFQGYIPVAARLEVPTLVEVAIAIVSSFNADSNGSLKDLFPDKSCQLKPKTLNFFPLAL